MPEDNMFVGPPKPLNEQETDDKDSSRSVVTTRNNQLDERDRPHVDPYDDNLGQVTKIPS